MTKTPLALFVALLGTGMTLPAIAQQQNAQPQAGMQVQQQGTAAGMNRAGGMSIRVGHEVVDAVDDVRESVADLVGSLRRSGSNFGLTNWTQSDGQLAQMEQQLQQQMEHRLDEKADRTDDSWNAWITGADYKVSVTKEVNTLASNLDDISKMLSGAKGSGLQQIDSADVTEQVDDLQETVEDLVQALEDTDGLVANRQQLQQAQQRLNTMEQELDRQADMAEDEWSLYATGEQFTPGVQKNVSELAQILRGLFNQAS